MARSYPADNRAQHFFEQQYTKENTARLQFYFDNKRGQGGSSAGRFGGGRSSHVGAGLPSINPMEFAIKKKREEDAELRRIVEEARRKYTKEEMFAPDPVIKKDLFEGFTKEGKGRYQYLAKRHRDIPEKKYSFPMLSSWDYGWKMNENAQMKHPPFARTKLVKDTFYTRNGVPTLSDPCARPDFNRSYTTV